MDYLLFAIALVLLLTAGAGMTSILADQGLRLTLCESIGLAFLLGTLTISILSFILGLFLTGLPLRITVASLAMALGITAAVRYRKSRFIEWNLPSSFEWLWIAILMVQSLIVLWASLRLSLGYDGLFLWEAKARLILDAGGVMPLDYFRASPFYLPHPNYPLLLPLTESWFYGFLGQPHQGLLKLILPLFYFAAVCLLVGRRMGKSYLPAVLLFFVPVVIIRATSGEADFPIAVFYLASCIFLFDSMRSPESRRYLLAGVLAASLPWVKQEGLILWLVIMIVGVAVIARRREWRALAMFVAPGLVWIAFWRIFLVLTGSQAYPAYLPITWDVLIHNAHRVPAIVARAFVEMCRWRDWSLLWLLPLAGLLRLRQTWSWTVLCLAPVILYCGIYIFSAWVPFTGHMEASMSRLLTHVSLVVLLGLSGSVLRFGQAKAL